MQGCVVPENVSVILQYNCLHSQLPPPPPPGPMSSLHQASSLSAIMSSYAAPWSHFFEFILSKINTTKAKKVTLLIKRLSSELTKDPKVA